MHPIFLFYRRFFASGKLADACKLRVIELTQNLVADDCDGIGEIKRADESEHRYSYASFIILLKQIFRQSAAFFAEHKVNILILWVFYLAMASLSFGGAKEEFTLIF